jgi:hypothetical protein
MLEDTLIYKRLKRAKLLFDSVAWYEAFTPQIKTTILDLIRDDQLTAKGVDMDGDIIGRYSHATELMSGGAKLEGDHFTLDDTGDFYRSMFITVLRNSIIIDGDTEKMENSFSQKNGLWWRDEILGLTDENLQLVIIEIKKKYIQYARKVLEID